MSGVFGEPLTGDHARRYARIVMARQTGWTLDYIDGLSLTDWLDYVAVARAEADLVRMTNKRSAISVQQSAK